MLNKSIPGEERLFQEPLSHGARLLASVLVSGQTLGWFPGSCSIPVELACLRSSPSSDRVKLFILSLSKERFLCPGRISSHSFLLFRYNQSSKKASRSPS